MHRHIVYISALGVLALFGVPSAGCSGCSDQSGIGVERPPILSVSPERLTFPQTRVGEVSAQVVHLGNIGGGLLEVTNTRIESDSATEFGVVEQVIPPLEDNGETVELIVQYSPQNRGADTAILIVESNGGEGRVQLSTLAATGDIVATPSPLDFGDVPPGDSEIRFTDVLNVGSAAFSVDYVGLDNESSDDFRITALELCNGRDLENAVCNDATGTISVEPDSSLRVHLEYTPREGDTDIGTILLQTSLPDHEEFRVPVTGNEPAPSIALLPNRINFGATPQDGASAPFLVRNVGTMALTVESISQGFPANEAFSSDAPEESFELAPGDEREVNVSFLPPLSTDETFALFFVQSNAPTAGQDFVEVKGRLDAPAISVLPETVHFGNGAQQVEIRREVIISNVGSRLLTLQELVLGPNSAADFDFVPPAQNTIEAGASTTLEVIFTPNEADWVEGSLLIRSDDPFRPEVSVALVGRNLGDAYCAARAREQSKNFGLVGFGREKVLPVDFVGTGTTHCDIREIRIDYDLEGLNLPFGGANPEPFQIVEEPDPARLQPGLSSVMVSYSPTDEGLFDFGDQATLVLVYEDPTNPGDLTELRTRLQGMGGESNIAVLPASIDFGPVTLNCVSQTRSVTIYNTGVAEFSLRSYELRGQAGVCTPGPAGEPAEFQVVDRPALPAIVVPARPAAFQVRYEPRDVGEDICELVFLSDAENQGELIVPLRGEGTLFSEVTDSFVQTSGQLTDVLFVVDNSGSMDDEQENLARNMLDFTAAAVWDNDYHVGVVTTELGGDEIFGAQNASPDRGKLVGNPRIITQAEDVATFQANIRVGSGGGGAQESGLEAARLALSDPWVRAQPRGQCGGDGDCQDGEECVNGACVGYNRGFLRDDASLELVFLSDEEDQSPARVDFYVDFFRSIKGFRNEGLLHASAIVGDRNGGCESNNGSAQAGNRYIQVVDATNGTFQSICARDYAQALSNIGDRAFGLRVEFFLSRVAEADTVAVEVEGQARDQDWEYDPETNSVVFEQGAVPQPGQRVDISYTARCFR